MMTTGEKKEEILSNKMGILSHGNCCGYRILSKSFTISVHSLLLLRV